MIDAILSGEALPVNPRRSRASVYRPIEKVFSEISYNHTYFTNKKSKNRKYVRFDYWRTCLLSVHVTSLKSYFLSARAQISYVVDSLLFINWQIWNNDQKPKSFKPEKAIKYTNQIQFLFVFFLILNIQPRGRSTKPKSGEVGKVRRSSSASVSGRRCSCICIFETGVFVF